eukprot:2974427-Pyramimonas_sp.AAC.1
MRGCPLAEVRQRRKQLNVYNVLAPAPPAPPLLRASSSAPAPPETSRPRGDAERQLVGARAGCIARCA